MPALSLSVPNPLGQQEASQRLKSFLTKLKEHYQDKVSNLEEEWPDENYLKYRFKTFGFDIQGDAKIEPQVDWKSTDEHRRQDSNLQPALSKKVALSN